jgi:hypothetical protein
MAEESIIGKAISLIPGVSKPRRSKKATTPKAQLAALTRNLAKLVADVEKLSQMMGADKKTSRRRMTTSSRAGTARKSRTARA